MKNTKKDWWNQCAVSQYARQTLKFYDKYQEYTLEQLESYFGTDAVLIFLKELKKKRLLQDRGNIWALTRTAKKLKNDKVHGKGLFNTKIKNTQVLNLGTELDQVHTAMQLWNDNAYTRVHRSGTKTYNTALVALKELFDGSFFKKFDDSELRASKLTLRKTYQKRDFEESLINLNISVESTLHYPANKEKLKKYIRSQTLAQFLYNTYSPNDQKSLFLQYQSAPRMFSAIEPVDKKLYNKILSHFDQLCEYEFDHVEFNAIAFCVNKFLELLGKQKSLITFDQKLDLLLNHINKKFKDYDDPSSYKMLRAPWFWEEFKHSLDKRGFLK